MMKCPECERTGQRSKLYMPTGYFSTAMGGTQTYYDEDGHRHHHEVNSSHGQGSCSNGHLLDVRLSDKCPAPDCNYGSPQTITFTGTRPAEPAPILGYRLDNVAFTVPREPGVSSGTEHKENH